MKKNYIAPSTEMATLASMGLMDGIAFAMETVSGGGSANATISEMNAID
jgi:hypothetical protein